MTRLSNWAVARPVRALIAWFALLVVIAVLGGRFGGQLKDSFELPGTESQIAQDMLLQIAGTDSATGAAATIVWAPDSGSVTAQEVEDLVTPLLKSTASLAGVACVSSPYGQQYGDSCPAPPEPQKGAFPPPPEIQAQIDAGTKAAIAATSPISPDGTVAYAPVLFDDATDVPTETAVTILEETAALDAEEGIRAGAAGAVLEFAGQEPPSGEIIGIGVAIVILLLAFGSVIAAGLPIVVAVFGLGAGLTLVTFTANFFTVATFAPTLAAMIGLGVGIDYALFILDRYRQAVFAGHPAKEAALEAVHTAGRAVQFAGGTVIIALLGLLVLGIGFFNGLAIAASLTVLLVMLSALWMLPALISLLGLKTFALRMPWNPKDRQWHPQGGAWVRYGRFLQKRPWLYVGLSLLILVLAAIPTFSARLGFPDDGGKPEGKPARVAYDLLAEGFGPGFNGPFFIAVQLPLPQDTEAMRSMIDAVQATPGVDRTIPNVEMLPVSLPQYQTVVAMQVIPTTAPQDPATVDLLNTLRETTIPDVTEGTTMAAYVGGFTAVTSDFTGVIRSALPIFLAVVVGLGYVALALLFRSLIVPALGALTSLLSLGAALGISVAVFQWGWGAGLLGVTATGPLLPFLPVMVFAILFGLSMDYQVFLVSRMQEEWLHSGNNGRAVRRGLAGSGRVVAIAATIMSSVFLAFIPTPDNTIKLFGVALAAAVLLDAFVIRLVLVPSLISAIGPRTWWMPERLKRSLPDMHIEDEGGSDEIVDDVAVPV